MLSSFGGDYNKAATAYCGLEAKVTDPKTGNTLTGFICDGFDDKVSPENRPASNASGTRLVAGSGNHSRAPMQHPLTPCIASPLASAAYPTVGTLSRLDRPDNRCRT